MSISFEKLNWRDDAKRGYSEAKAGPLRLRIYEAGCRWVAEIYEGRRKLADFSGFRDIGEASIGAGLFAEGYLAGSGKPKDGG